MVADDANAPMQPCPCGPHRYPMHLTVAEDSAIDAREHRVHHLMGSARVHALLGGIVEHAIELDDRERGSEPRDALSSNSA